MASASTSKQHVGEPMEPSVYKVRPGTMDHGRDYHTKVTALLSLRCLFEDPKHMWLATDVDGCGSFDDIIIYRQTKDENIKMYLINVKFGLKPKRITEKSFTSKLSTDLAELNTVILNKTPGESEIINCLRQAQKRVFVIFTNREVAESEVLEKVHEKSNLDLSFLNTGGNVHQFRKHEYNKELVENLFLFADQVQEMKIDQEIMNAIHYLIDPFKIRSSPCWELMKQYVGFVEEWSKGFLGGHYPLNQNRILKVLAGFLFEPYMEKSFYQTKFRNDYNINKIWHIITANKNLITVSMNAGDVNDNDNSIIMKFLWRYIHEEFSRFPKLLKCYSNNWEEIFTEEDKNELYQNTEGAFKQELLRTIGSRNKITLNSIYRALCNIKQIPIVLKTDTEEDFKRVLRLIEFSNNAFKVILLNTSNVEKFEKVSEARNTFNNLRDLNPEECEAVLQLPGNFQGKPITLKNLIEKHESLTKFIDVRNIIKALTDNLNIGNTLNELPEYYITRKMQLRDFTKETVLLNIELLLEAVESYGDIYVIYYNSKETLDFWKDFLNIPVSYIVDYQIIREPKEIPINCRIITVLGTPNEDTAVDLNKHDKNIHHLKLYSDSTLELFKTVGSAENLSLLILPTKSDQLQREYYTTPEPGELKIINGSPGIGKTTMLNSIAKKTSPDIWVLQIKLRDYINHYDSEEFDIFNQNPDKHLIHFNNQILQRNGNLNSTNANVFSDFLDSNCVLLLLDGFNEISPTHKVKVTRMIHSFKTKNYRVYLTTRPVLKTYLEREFNCVSVTIPKLNEEEKLNFLEKYFSRMLNPSGDSSKNENIREFSIKLLNMIGGILNHYQEPLTGIPLQIELLAKLYENHCSTYSVTPDFDIQVHFDLHKLCEALVSEKMRILTRKHGDYARVTYESYCRDDQTLMAIKFLFPLIDLRQQIYSTSSEDRLEMIQRDGIIVTDGNPENIEFVDQIFAEYFVAQWLFRNSNSDIANTVRNQNYGTLSILGEIIRAKNSIT